ncbi:glucosyltransferase [Mycena vulgaris]|nr:glucosyltransferase [Mycena vulgaris]
MLVPAFSQLIGGWMETLPQLAQGSEGWLKPQALHMDIFGGGFVIEPTKQIVGPSCKILAWFSSALVSMPAHLTEYDYAAIAREIHADEARREGRSMEEILEAVAMAGNGSDKLSGVVLQCPGIPDIYDHERFAYGVGAKAGAQMLVSAQTLAKSVDGYFRLYQKCGQEIFTVGPQAHELCWSDAPSVPHTNALISGSIRLYISFGSLFFPITTPQTVEALVSTLLHLEKPIPFVFALGGKMASLPKELIETVNASGKGLICDFWIEQRAILQHAALGWFLTHGGFNSISESLSQGIPLIVWPTNAEQPINAALLSSGPNPVAFELHQIRTGAQLGPSLRNGPKITGTVEDAAAEFEAVFAAARGSKGAVLAANAQKTARALREARAGEVSHELIRLARF